MNERKLTRITSVMLIVAVIGFAVMAIRQSPEARSFVPEHRDTAAESSLRIKKIAELTRKPGWHKNEATVREVERLYRQSEIDRDQPAGRIDDALLDRVSPGP